MSTLEIRDLYASVETKEGRKQILRGVNLTVNSGETHAIMANRTVRESRRWPTLWQATRNTRWIRVRCCWTARTFSR